MPKTSNKSVAEPQMESVIIKGELWSNHGGKIMRLIRDLMLTDDYKLRYLRDKNYFKSTEIIFAEPGRAAEFKLRCDPKEWA